MAGDLLLKCLVVRMIRKTPDGPPASAPPSGFSAAFLSASRFLARAVVDRTALDAVTATLLLSAVTGLGYANSDGLHLHTTCIARGCLELILGEAGCVFSSPTNALIVLLRRQALIESSVVTWQRWHALAAYGQLCHSQTERSVLMKI